MIMALPEKNLPLIYYKTKEDYEAKMASMSSEELEKYNSFYLGFIEDTRELHSHGAIYKCSRSWDLDIVRNNATEFVTFAEMGDTVTINSQELGTLTYKGVESNIFVIIIISYKDGKSKKLECASDNNGVSWYIEDVTDLSFVKTSDVVSTASTINTVVGRDGAGDIWVRNLVDSNGNIVAFPNGTEASIEGSDYILQEQIDDLDTIRNNAKTAAAAIQNLEKDIESLNQSVENKADKATTLKGYGIIDDYYTDAEVDILLEEVREDVQKEYLPLSGGTITGSLTTKGIVPYAAQAFNLGSSSLPYNIIYSRKSTARELHSNATANGANSLATMYGCFSGRVSGDETYPYVSLYPFQTKPIQINGVTVYGIELAPSSSATYTYNGVEHTVVNPDTGRYAMVAIIEDALFIGKTNTLNKAFCYSSSGEYWNYESYLLKISDIESAKELIIRGYTSSIPFNTSLAFNIIAFKKSNSSNDKGDYSLSMGQNSNSLKNFALTIGRSTAAAGIGAIALGNQSIAYGLYSIALGFMSAAISPYSLALGSRSIAAHDYSIVMAGYGRSGTAYQTSVGYCNEGKSNTIFEVGYGVTTARKNIFEVTTSGNVTSTGTNTATKHITSGGTSSQFVKGDGSLDSTSYATSDENYMLNIGAATGAIQSAVFDKVKSAKTVSINYNSGQYVITITSREKSGSNYRYSAMFPAMDSTFKMFMIDFTVSNSSNAVSYTVTLANLAIGAATVSE